MTDERSIASVVVVPSITGRMSQPMDHLTHPSHLGSRQLQRFFSLLDITSEVGPRSDLISLPSRYAQSADVPS